MKYKKNISQRLGKYKWMIVLLVIYLLITLLCAFLYSILPLPAMFGLYNENSFYQNLISGMHNSIIDFVMLGIFLSAFLDKSQKSTIIREYKDKIDDCRFWNSEEASYRIRALICRLQEIGVFEYDLSKCYIKSIKLKKIELNNSKIMGAVFNNSNLEKSIFKKCNFQGAFFYTSVLKTCDFLKCNLKYIKCNNANLRSLKAIDCNFKNADFTNANLYAAIIKNCDMEKVNFTNCNLERANLLGNLNLDPKELIKCKTLKNAKMDNDIIEAVKKLNSNLL